MVDVHQNIPIRAAQCINASCTPLANTNSLGSRTVRGAGLPNICVIKLSDEGGVPANNQDTHIKKKLNSYRKGQFDCTTVVPIFAENNYRQAETIALCFLPERTGHKSLVPLLVFYSMLKS